MSQGKRHADECLRANYRQYNLLSRYLDVLIADSASLDRLLRCPPTVSGLFDAIVTDPPYGVRERTCRVASEAIEKEPSMQTTMYIDVITGECVSYSPLYCCCCFCYCLHREDLVLRDFRFGNRFDGFLCKQLY